MSMPMSLLSILPYVIEVLPYFFLIISNDPKDILKQLNCDVDLVIDVGPIESKASTIIDLTSNKMNYIKRD